MVEITTGRFMELIAAEQTLKAVKRVVNDTSIASYAREDVLRVLCADDSEVNMDAE